MNRGFDIKTFLVGVFLGSFVLCLDGPSIILPIATNCNLVFTLVINVLVYSLCHSVSP